MPEPSPASIGASAPASSDARNELTRWMRVGRRVAPPDRCLANARICGPVKRSNAREPVLRASRAAPPTAAVDLARTRADVLESIQTGATGAREHVRQLLRERLRRVERRPSAARPRVVQIHAAVLLRRSGDRGDTGRPPAPTARARHRAIERLDPHQRRRDGDARVGRRQDAVARAVRRKIAIEIRRVLEHETRRVRVDVNRLQRQMLRAGVETEVQGHGARILARRDLSRRVSPHALAPRRILVSKQRRRVRADPAVAGAPLEFDLGQPVFDRRRRGPSRSGDSCRSRRSAPRAAAPPDRRRRTTSYAAAVRTDRDAARSASRGSGPPRSHATAPSIAAMTSRRSGCSIPIRKRTMRDRLLAADRRMLVGARRRRRERHLVVLLAPAGERAVDANLRARGSRRCPRATASAARAAARRDRRTSNGGRAAATSSQQRQHADHRVVVERDVARVVGAQREVLRPAAVRILRREQVVEAARATRRRTRSSPSRPRARARGIASA